MVVTVWIIGFVSAFNFTGGVNGFSWAHALIGGAAYACLGWLRPDPTATPSPPRTARPTSPP
jgi:UDP-GlcNAc:undecaprenyl-phosphate/decaprenyl-phosphate GlcNAc-1-phosphate transferase